MSDFRQREHARVMRHVENVKAERGEIAQALSVQQPWAWLLVHGPKDIENRSWPTKFRGWCLIHASKTFDLEGWYLIEEKFPSLAASMPGPDRMLFERGGIIGAVKFVDCVRSHASPWFQGAWGFVVGDRKVLPFRECKGSLGFFRPQEAATSGTRGARPSVGECAQCEGGPLP